MSDFTKDWCLRMAQAEQGYEIGAGLPFGMTIWNGGNAPPHNWAGGPVLFRDGTLSDLYSEGWDWSHTITDPPQVRAVEIIAYFPHPAKDTDDGE